MKFICYILIIFLQVKVKLTTIVNNDIVLLTINNHHSIIVTYRHENPIDDQLPNSYWILRTTKI